MDVGFDGEEDVVATGEVPVLGLGAHDAEAAGEGVVGLAGAGKGGVRVGAHEDDDGVSRPLAASGQGQR